MVEHRERGNMTEFTISNIQLEDIDYPLEKIQYLSRIMMMVEVDEFESEDYDRLHYDFFVLINKNAKEARKELKKIENGNAAD